MGFARLLRSAARWSRTGRDKAGRTSQISHQKSDATVFCSLDYQRDASGDVSKISRESGRTFYYTYDKLQQITSEVIKAPDLTALYSFEYEYDGARNRTHKVFKGENTYYEYNKANELRREYKGSQNQYYFYDLKGNQVRQRKWDGFDQYFQFDDENMLTRALYQAGTHVYFRYNALLENTKEVDWSAPAGDLRYYDYDRIDKVAAKDDLHVTRERYALGLSRMPVERHVAKCENPSGGISSSYHEDDAGTVIRIIAANQSDLGPYLLDAFGNALNEPSFFSQRFKFHGKEHVSALNIYRHFVRSYCSSTSRWLSRDPIASGNRYAPFGNSPSARIDILGLEPTPIRDWLRGSCEAYHYYLKNPRSPSINVHLTITRSSFSSAQGQEAVGETAAVPSDIHLKASDPWLSEILGTGHAKITVSTVGFKDCRPTTEYYTLMKCGCLMKVCWSCIVESADVVMKIAKLTEKEIGPNINWGFENTREHERTHALLVAEFVDSFNQQIQNAPGNVLCAELLGVSGWSSPTDEARCYDDACNSAWNRFDAATAGSDCDKDKALKDRFGRMIFEKMRGWPTSISPLYPWLPEPFQRWLERTNALDKLGYVEYLLLRRLSAGGDVYIEKLVHDVHTILRDVVFRAGMPEGHSFDWRGVRITFASIRSE